MIAEYHCWALTHMALFGLSLPQMRQSKSWPQTVSLYSAYLSLPPRTVIVSAPPKVLLCQACQPCHASKTKQPEYTCGSFLNSSHLAICDSIKLCGPLAFGDVVGPRIPASLYSRLPLACSRSAAPSPIHWHSGALPIPRPASHLTRSLLRSTVVIVRVFLSPLAFGSSTSTLVTAPLRT